MGEPLDANAGLEYAVTVDGDQNIYEVGVRMFDNYGGFSGGETIVTPLDVGDVVSIDLVANTCWSSGFGMLSENLMTGKSGNADRFAGYALVKQITCADLDRNGSLNFADLAIIADNWLSGK